MYNDRAERTHIVGLANAKEEAVLFREMSTLEKQFPTNLLKLPTTDALLKPFK